MPRLPAARRKTGRVVLCYRNEETGIWARQLRERLAAEFGENQIVALSDTLDSIPDLDRHIKDCVADCVVCLPIFSGGRDTSGNGSSRLELPSDIVRRVIACALASERRIIPIMTGGAKMPSVRDLPASLQAFASRQAIAMGSQVTAADCRMLTITIRQGREGDLTAENANLLVAAAFSLIAPQLFYGVDNALVSRIVDPISVATSALFDFRFVIASLIWLLCFGATCAAHFWLLGRRGSRLTEPERTIFQFATGTLLGGSGLLAALRIVMDDFSTWPSTSVLILMPTTRVFSPQGVYAAGCIVACLLIAAGSFRRFAERGSQLSQVEWFVCSSATFVWAYFTFAPVYAILDNIKELHPALALMNAEVVQITAGLALTLVVVVLARFARRRGVEAITESR